MALVLHGMGLGDVNTGSTVVAFGLVNDPQGPLIPTLQSASIDDLFVIDYGSQFMRPLTKAEYRQFKRLVKLLETGQVLFKEETRRGKKGILVYRDRGVRKNISGVSNART